MFYGVLDRYYFIRLVVFWLSYAKVSISVLEYKQPKAKDYGVVQIRNFNKEMVKLG
ncbi:hypothetical protein BSPWISOXPB_2040 [uncultured Gammaproteobacteria bacterium]|nr:hypothetical protein BSPWISOXPB_2335 [uncultured Gammaproteobacteria bacterium]VVM25343.1 hypothetical protein BSPWISOXPB_2040 [uncultured Gammaproteobacteria bacterium]